MFFCGGLLFITPTQRKQHQSRHPRSGFLSYPVFTWDLGSEVKGERVNPAGWTTAALLHFLSVPLHEKRRFGRRMSEQGLIREQGAKESRVRGQGRSSG